MRGRRIRQLPSPQIASIGEGFFGIPPFCFQEVTTMRLGAVLIAAGKCANPMLPSGEITVAQRMIASLQKAGVTLIAVVTGPEDKKMEKQLQLPGAFIIYSSKTLMIILAPIGNCSGTISTLPLTCSFHAARQVWKLPDSASWLN